MSKTRNIAQDSRNAVDKAGFSENDGPTVSALLFSQSRYVEELTKADARTHKAEAERDRLREALEQIAKETISSDDDGLIAASIARVALADVPAGDKE